MEEARVQVYYLSDMPAGPRRWAWFGMELLVIDAALDDTCRRAAIDDAFTAARRGALGPPPGSIAA